MESPRGMTQVTCTECNQPTEVPFVPTPGRPVYCRACFSKRNNSPSGGGPARFSRPQSRRDGPPPRPVSGARKRMLAQGRKGHFMYDAREILSQTEGGMDDQHHRAFLEGLFARGARGSTEDAQVFLDEKLAEGTITEDERNGLGRLLERYSFWR
ncbi:MAG TPA: CxxC-x17-CxxC domain-containing protein [Candidatus Thermoplasmatota archaeon]|nr:CxxC-x17-CxxC domain-containing protein [Candidatus Thermoplasmatota archaeon]